jgi:hypothetical protein
MARRASVPEGKSIFFRRAAEETPPEPEATFETPAATVEASVTDAAPERGTTRQSAIFLEERHLDWLEDKCRESRQRGGRAIRKALIIRALLDVAMECPIDLTSLRRDEDLHARIRKGFGLDAP